MKNWFGLELEEDLFERVNVLGRMFRFEFYSIFKLNRRLFFFED